jgi:hypothetical protein
MNHVVVRRGLVARSGSYEVELSSRPGYSLLGNLAHRIKVGLDVLPVPTWDRCNNLVYESER